MIEEGQKFKKWQWIDVTVEKATKDHRPESHRVYVDTIQCMEEIDTREGWGTRRAWLERVPSFGSIEDIDATRAEDGLSIALLRPKRVLRLEIEKARSPEWTAEEREKLAREMMQGDLFSESEARRAIRELRKVPYDFYYTCECETSSGLASRRLKIVDWEAGALFWNCQRKHGSEWEAPFRQKLESDLLGKDLMLLVGNLHRFQNQWLVISLFYPPMRTPPETLQGSLF
jgi:hypothetical protein